MNALEDVKLLGLIVAAAFGTLSLGALIIDAIYCLQRAAG
jgi:hypothetical protein